LQTSLMDDTVPSPASPQNRKRPAAEEPSPSKKLLNLKGTQFVMPTPPDTDQSSNASPGNVGTRVASPAPSSSALSSIQDVESNPGTSTNTNADAVTSTEKVAGTGPPPAKRRKLTLSEKVEQQRAKEAKAAEKAEQKARKDEEKRVRDEEKRLKAEEKEAKKREKDLEEERKNQDKLKKERSQMRLGAFFQKPATPAKATAAIGDLEDSAIRARRRSLSLETYGEVAEQARLSDSPAQPGKGTPKATQPAKPSQLALNQTPCKPAISDYRKYFLPFDLQSHTVLAPLKYTNRTSDESENAQAVFDADLNDPTLQEKYDLGLVPSYANIEKILPTEQRACGHADFPTARQIVEQIHGSSSQQPIDLTQDVSFENPVDLLQSLPLRYLHFAEDVRPPYFGTYTRIRSKTSARRLSRNPFARERDDTNYDYDSEAEWEEPEEGEDILNDEDDEAESNGDPDEMDEFLDDEHDELRNKRKLITGDLLPVSTGLCWEDEKRKVVLSTEHSEGASDLSDMRMDFILPGFTGKTIDPFSTAYWEQSMPPPGLSVRDTFGLSHQPVRQPLKERHNSNSATPNLVGAAQGEKGPINSVVATQGVQRGRKATPRVLSKKDMDEFKDAVVGSVLKKADLTKGLKSRQVYLAPIPSTT
jgi:chromatin assembly factor 1 subunit A